MATEARDPMTVVQALNDASNSNDLERAVGLFAEDAVIRQIPPPPPPSSGVWTGQQEIRAWFEPQLQNFRVDSQNIQVDGERVTWDASVSGDMVRQMGLDTADVKAEAIVKDGKITSFVVTQTPESVSKMLAVMERGAQQGGASA